MPVVLSGDDVFSLSVEGLLLTLVGGEGLLDGAVTEVLDGGLELVVTVKVGGPSSGVEGLGQLGFERVDHKADFDASVAGEDGVGVDSLEFEGPVADEDNLLV